MKNPDEEKKQLQEERKNFALESIVNAGFDVHFETDSELRFMHKGQEVKFFPYTGWHTGKSIKDGRGLKNLLKQIK